METRPDKSGRSVETDSVTEGLGRRALPAVSRSIRLAAQALGACILVLFIIKAAAIGLNQQTFSRRSGENKMVFSVKALSLGVLRSGELAQGWFSIQNAGTNPLGRLRAEPSCSCTTAFLQSTELSPGADTIVYIVFASEGQRGVTTTSISIYDGTGVKLGSVPIQAWVRPAAGVSIVPPSISFGPVAIGDQKEREFEISGASEVLSKIVMESSTPCLEVTPIHVVEPLPGFPGLSSARWKVGLRPKDETTSADAASIKITAPGVDGMLPVVWTLSQDAAVIFPDRIFLGELSLQHHIQTSVFVNRSEPVDLEMETAHVQTAAAVPGESAVGPGAPSSNGLRLEWQSAVEEQGQRLSLDFVNESETGRMLQKIIRVKEKKSQKVIGRLVVSGYMNEQAESGTAGK